MLGYDLSRPAAAGDGSTVLVLLHGRGSHRGDLQALRPRLPEEWVLVTPQAPHPGHLWGYGPGWAWYRYEEEDRVDEGSFAWSLGALDRFLAALPARLGFRPGRIVVGGFSQGGTMSLAHAITRPGTVAGAINLSGFLVDSAAVRLPDAGGERTPIFWAHGLRDTAVPHRLAVRGRARLKAAGVFLIERDYDIGHWIAPEAIADAVAFVKGLP